MEEDAQQIRRTTADATRILFRVASERLIPLSKEEAHGTSEEKVERAYSFDRSPEAGGS